MPGIASIASDSAPDHEKIQLFYNTENLQLALQLKDGTKTGDDPDQTYVAKSTDQKGIIVNSSDLGACQFYGMNLVIGFTQPVLASGTTEYSNYCLSIVSPVYRSLVPTVPISNVTTAACSDGTKAWIYYLDTDSDNNITLEECALEDYATTDYGGTSTILKGSHLAAYWDTKDRYVIYQHTDKNHHLHEYGAKTDTEITNTSGALKGTAIAATYTGGKVYLYYTDTESKIMRVIKDGGTWGSASSVSATVSTTVSDTSQLAVTTVGSYNHLFYVAKGGDSTKMTHIRDAL